MRTHLLCPLSLDSPVITLFVPVPDGRFPMCPPVGPLLGYKADGLPSRGSWKLLKHSEGGDITHKKESRSIYNGLIPAFFRLKSSDPVLSQTILSLSLSPPFLPPPSLCLSLCVMCAIHAYTGMRAHRRTLAALLYHVSPHKETRNKSLCKASNTSRTPHAFRLK